jgi:hypothetical protein
MYAKEPRSLHTTSRSMLADRCITTLFVLIVLLGSFFVLSGSALAAAASTTTPQIPLSGWCDSSLPRCYAVRDWPGHTGGAVTAINPFGALRCYGCIGFIDDEMWFLDPNSSQCMNDMYGVCQVEAGVATYPASNPKDCNPGHDSTCLFWADIRPDPGGFHDWPLYTFGADGVSLSPYLIYITIANASGFSSSGSTWVITTNIYQYGSWIAGPSGQSTSNSMNVNEIEIGSELSDSHGSADVFYLQYNQWMDGSGGWHYQTTTGNNNSTNPPPTGQWAVNPCNCNGNTGGEFETYDNS